MTILELHILVIMVLRGSDRQKREALAILGPEMFARIIKASGGDIQ